MKSKFRLTLFVSGASAASYRARRNLAALCGARIGGEYPVDLVDVTEDVEAAERSKVVVTPMLMRTFPLPERRIAGDLADHEAVLRLLDVPAEGPGVLRLVRSDRLPAPPVVAGSNGVRRLLWVSAQVVADDPLYEALARLVPIKALSSLAAAAKALVTEVATAVVVDASAVTGSQQTTDTLRAICYDFPVILLADGGTQAQGAASQAVRCGIQATVTRRDATATTLLQHLVAAIERHRGYDQFRRLLSASPEGMLIIDADSVVQYSNPAAERLLGRSGDALAGQVFDLPGHDRELRTHRIDLAPDKVLEAQLSVVDWNGRTSHLVSMRDVTARVRAHESSLSAVEALQRRNVLLLEEASHDPLTRALNRRGLAAILQDEVERARRFGGTLSALLLDCDDFKGINDTFGHAGGDVALRFLADMARQTARPHDRVARVGGDEFLVLLPGARVAEAIILAERLLDRLKSTPMPAPLSERTLGVSIGATAVHHDVEDVEAVIASASRALKLSKVHGKRRVSTTADGERTEDAAQLDRDIADLLQPGRLHVASQGIQELPSGKRVAQELLIRGPSGTYELPANLFALARTVSMSTDFDRFCLRATLQAARGLPAGERIHVNVLPTTLASDTTGTFLPLLRQHVSGERRICVEIDTQQIVGDPSYLLPHREQLRDGGVLVALDGLSFERASLESLVVLRPDFAKLSQTRLDASPDPARLRELRRMVNIARSLGIEIIATGVESRRAAEAVAEAGIRLAQGHHWSHATPLTPA